MPKSTFADRLAYLRWRWAAGSIKATDGAFAAWLGVDDGWYSKWKRERPGTPARAEYKAIKDRLGAAAADWLFDEDGEPPELELWKRWTMKVAEPAPPYYGAKPAQEKPPAAKKPKKPKPNRKAS